MSKRYPPEIHRFIRDNVTSHTTEELALMTNAAFGTDFTKSSMKSYKKNHKLRSGMPCGVQKGTPSKQFPAPIVAYIQENYQGVGPTEMAAQLNRSFGTSYTARQLNSYYRNHHLNSGLTGCFEKGHIPSNKGKKGCCAPGCEKGWFKKGSDPWNTLPVGTIITKSDGYLYKKVDEKPGGGQHNWKQLHILLWEETNGPVPEGSRVIFKDGNRQNCVLENLALITIAENAVMNRCGLRFEQAEYTETGILIAKIKIAAQTEVKKNH